MRYTSPELQITDADLANYSKPPTTRQLQHHFGLSRKEAVRFHKQHDASYANRWQGGGVENYKHWHSFTFQLCQQIKSSRLTPRDRTKIIAKAASELEVSHLADISLAEGHQLESGEVQL